MAKISGLVRFSKKGIASGFHLDERWNVEKDTRKYQNWLQVW